MQMMITCRYDTNANDGSHAGMILMQMMDHMILMQMMDHMQV